MKITPIASEFIGILASVVKMYRGYIVYHRWLGWQISILYLTGLKMIRLGNILLMNIVYGLNNMYHPWLSYFWL